MAFKSIRRLIGRGGAELTPPTDGNGTSRRPPDDATGEEPAMGWWKPVGQPLVDAMWRDVKASGGRWWEAVASHDSVKAVLNGPDDRRRAVALVLAERQVRSGFRIGYDDRQQFEGRVLGSLGGRRPKFTATEAEYIVELATRTERDFRYFELLPFHVGVAERYVKAHGVDRIRPALERLLASVEETAWPQGGQAAIRGRIRTLLGVGSHDWDLSPIDASDALGARMHAEIPQLPVDPVGTSALLLHLASPIGPTPTRAWERSCRELVRSTRDVARVLEVMLTTSAEMREEHRRAVDAAFRRAAATGDDAELRAAPIIWAVLNPTNEKLLRGVIWAASYAGGPWVADALERQPDVAALHALASLDEPAARAALSRLYATTRDRGARKQLERALQTAAQRSSSSVSELLEGAAATHDLDDTGRVALSVGELAASIEVGTDGRVRTHWTRGDAPLRGLPKNARESHAAAVRRVEQRAERLRETVAAERSRIEELFTEGRTWAWDAWRRAYLDHPLTGRIGRGLIWEFIDKGGDRVSAIGAADPPARWRSAADDVVDVSDRQVRLWHPLDASDSEIQAWRDYLLARELAQPIKQAFREIYRLTPAEEQTEVYSNRFAGHVLRYQQAYALMRARGWSTNYLGPHSEGYSGTAKRSFRSAGIRAEFYHEAVEMGLTAEWCVTDQVRFLMADARAGAQPLPLRDVPARVFSEAMRDVDLFVRVTSIGNTPDWADRGLRQFDDCWERWAFGELTELAKVRRETIAKVIPQLAIADRLMLEDRWLRVRGDLATYRIHLGSSNIQIEPSSTYLCIVPGRGSSAKVFLPFDRDDDVGLSLVISKAFLLAGDAKITDETILRQIRR
ncbi:MAG: DUF4132 domain-containing protein [Chloroflexota bacterium]